LMRGTPIFICIYSNTMKNYSLYNNKAVKRFFIASLLFMFKEIIRKGQSAWFHIKYLFDNHKRLNVEQLNIENLIHNNSNKHKRLIHDHSNKINKSKLNMSKEEFYR
jgi:hypothetical protein